MRIDYYQEAKRIEEEVNEIYRHFHRTPELSGAERETQKWILNKLSQWGVECRSCADTGVYAVIKSGKDGHTIAFRGDMDALPVQEKTSHSFKSTRAGVMHACGHDAHMTIMLGCIKILQKYRENLRGNIVFLFQPSEEKNGGGARQMIADKVLDDPMVELITAFHIWPQKAGTYRALVFANLVSIYIKMGIGKLSAYCGAVNAGCAAACGIAYLDGASLEIISDIITNTLATISGIICDGAKSSCASKIAMSIQMGMLAYEMAKSGCRFQEGEGIVGKSVDETIEAIGRIGKDGMRETDSKILEIMLKG